MIPVGEANGQRKRRESSRPVRYIFYFRGERALHSTKESTKIFPPATLYLLQLRRRPDRSISHRRMTVGREYEAGKQDGGRKTGGRPFFFLPRPR